MWSHTMSHSGEDWIKMPGVNPTFWLNYLFFTNPFHWNETVKTASRTLVSVVNAFVCHSRLLLNCFQLWYFCSTYVATCTVCVEHVNDWIHWIPSSTLMAGPQADTPPSPPSLGGSWEPPLPDWLLRRRHASE